MAEMIEIPLREGEEFIKLGQLLKKAGLVDSGVDAKFIIQDGQVLVNGQVDTRRGKKMYPGDTASLNGESVRVIPCESNQ